MLKDNKNVIPDRIKSLIMCNHLDKSIEYYEREELLKISPQAIYGIGSYYATKLKLKANINSLADLANLNLSKTKDLGISSKLLEKWIISASIIVNFASGTEVISARRICIAGLSAAGKTSLLQTLQKQKTTSASYPTMGYAIEDLTFLGLKIAVWDLGGQIEFRNMYLSDPKQYLSETMLLIYVIDSQKDSLANETAQYLHELLVKLKYLKESPKVYLTLHKCDPNIKKAVLDVSISKILSNVSLVLLKHGIKKYRVLRTSIYDVETLVYLFSRIFADASPISQILSDSLAFYSQSHDISASYLITETGFLAAEWTELLINDQNEEIFLEIMENIRKEVYESPEKHKSLLIKSLSTGFFILINRIEFNTTKLFLCSVSQSYKSIDNIEMINFHKEIQPWIFNFFSIIKS